MDIARSKVPAIGFISGSTLRTNHSPMSKKAASSVDAPSAAVNYLSKRPEEHHRNPSNEHQAEAHRDDQGGTYAKRRKGPLHEVAAWGWIATAADRHRTENPATRSRLLGLSFRFYAAALEREETLSYHFLIALC
jgi:hypothetical protein